MTDPHASMPAHPPVEPQAAAGEPDDGPAGRGRTPPDPGTPASRGMALVAVTLLYLLIAVSQNLTPYMTPPENQLGREPQGGEMGKLMMLFERAFEGMGAPGQFARAAFNQIEASKHPADRLQGVLLLGESEGAERALAHLETVRTATGQAPRDATASSLPSPQWALVRAPEDPDAATPPDAPQEYVVDQKVILDADAMETLYTLGPDELSNDARAQLIDRYGWLGRLATTPESDTAARDDLYIDLPWAIGFLLLVFVLLVVWGLAGLGMCIVAIVMMATRRLRWRFTAPMPGGSVYLETFAVFLLGFGLVQVLGVVAAQAIRDATTVVRLSMAAQWLLLLTLFWPVLRGVRRPDWRGAVGWTAPDGVFREIAAGVAGYFAGVPILVTGMIVTVLLTFASAAIFGEPESPPTNPILEMLQSADVVTIVMLITLATIWAPIVEETLFRGAVYRHLRGRAGVLLCAVATAFLFAFMHSYGPLMVGPLIALGVTFAIIREWRGSLIGAMTAHCLHNATIMCLMLVAMRAMA
ncbi:MAG: CPBP family intramembrane glutamic endopeptidase [Phycisphaerales bacterium JB041]